MKKINLNRLEPFETEYSSFLQISLPAFVSEATETETKKVETTEEQPTQMETCE